MCHVMQGVSLKTQRHGNMAMHDTCMPLADNVRKNHHCRNAKPRPTPCVMQSPAALQAQKNHIFHLSPQFTLADWWLADSGVVQVRRGESRHAPTKCRLEEVAHPCLKAPKRRSSFSKLLGMLWASLEYFAHDHNKFAHNARCLGKGYRQLRKLQPGFGAQLFAYKFSDVHCLGHPLGSRS